MDSAWEQEKLEAEKYPKTAMIGRGSSPLRPSPTPAHKRWGPTHLSSETLYLAHSWTAKRIAVKETAANMM
jgi:hypothetical protein